jgi:hypothetical protein
MIEVSEKQTMNNANQAIHKAWQGSEPVEPLACVVLRVPDAMAQDPDPLIMACIPHRKDRLPIHFESDAGLLWRCADGRLEELAVGRDHADWVAIWKEIEGPGLLVCEMPDGSDQRIPQIGPVGHWILKRSGSSDWIPE